MGTPFPVRHLHRGLKQLNTSMIGTSFLGHAAPSVSLRRANVQTAVISNTIHAGRRFVLPLGYRFQSSFASLMDGIKERFNKYQGRELVGEDEMGNRYYEMKELDPTMNEALTRREVEYHAKMEDFEIMDIPTQWRSWLKHFRKDPPTREEIQRYEMQRQMILAKAADIDAAETKWKAEQKALAQKVVAEADTLAGALPFKTLTQQDQSDPSSQTGNDNEEAFLGEPSGQGETFEPGTWDPSVNK